MTLLLGDLGEIWFALGCLDRDVAEVYSIVSARNLPVENDVLYLKRS
jgi:hypothetical protein